MNNQERIEKSKQILNNLGLTYIEYLGIGTQGVVFFQNKWVYKVIFSESTDWNNTQWYRTFFKTHHFITNSFYKLEEIIEIEAKISVEKYNYEKGEQITNYTETEAIDLLANCWQEKITICDCKPENFIRVNGMLKVIDMGACTYYSDNLFLNSCVRMFIFIKYGNNENIEKIKRSAINNFNLPELKRISQFLTKVFNKIIFKQSESVLKNIQLKKNSALIYENYSLDKLPNLEKLFFIKLKEESLYLANIQINHVEISELSNCEVYLGYKKIQKCNRNISLLIKTCAMDVATIEQVVKHIVRQLSYPQTFQEILLSIDSKKDNFLRQYTSNSDYEKVIQIAEKLKKEKVIDRYVIFNPDDAAKINKDWFALETAQTHSTGNVPVASQLSAFEKCNGDYILQMDSDVMIGRKDFNHNYLQDMLTELDKNEKVISVGFNIYNKKSKPYFGFENGGFVPEVRMGLFHKKRFFNQRPFPNSLDKDGKLNLTWYRSAEIHQKNTGTCSIRGGDNRTFFIHPQNYRKSEVYTWMNILDRVEQLEIPECQYDNFDCQGSFYDWCISKRNENLVIVAIINNTEPSNFLRFWYSLLSQNLQNFGIILYDNCSENGIGFLIQYLIKDYKDRITFIRGRNKLTDLQCEFISIHNVCINQQSVIVCAEADNALIGNEALSSLYKKYQDNQCDLTCGVAFINGEVKTNYRESVDFLHPRTKISNVWSGLISFKKYLFDSIPLNHFTYENKELKISQRKWYENHKEMAKMIPMVEMCSKPLQLYFINYFVDKKSKTVKYLGRDNVETDLKKKHTLESKEIILDRKTFVTNKNRIDIDITFLCNLNCKGCIRSCGEAPSTDQMTIQDIQNFINESIRLGKKWERINVLGGEPTLHPDFFNIIELLQTKYADKFDSNLVIQVVSNGKISKSRDLCKDVEKFKNVIIDYNSYKTDNSIDFFTSFNDAPIDDSEFKNADFSKGCWVAADSGFGLNKNGYFACPNCSGIDRVMNLGIGLKSFNDLTDELMKKQFEICCKYCGFFKHYSSNMGNFIPRNQREPFRNIISKTWKESYAEYNKRK